MGIAGVSSDARTRQAAGPESADAATKTRRLAERRAFVDSWLNELLGAASASGWAPVFHGESRDDLRPVFLPVACRDKHALGDDARLEHGSNWRDQLRAVTQGYRPPGRIDILDSTLDRRPPLRGRRRPARGRRAPLGRWRDLRLGERRGDKDRRGQHRDEQRERVHVSTLMWWAWCCRPTISGPRNERRRRAPRRRSSCPRTSRILRGR